MEELDGVIPDTAEKLVKTLPGVGQYTAGLYYNRRFTMIILLLYHVTCGSLITVPHIPMAHFIHTIH